MSDISSMSACPPKLGNFLGLEDPVCLCCGALSSNIRSSCSNLADSASSSQDQSIRSSHEASGNLKSSNFQQSVWLSFKTVRPSSCFQVPAKKTNSIPYSGLNRLFIPPKRWQTSPQGHTLQRTYLAADIPAGSVEIGDEVVTRGAPLFFDKARTCKEHLGCAYTHWFDLGRFLAG